MSGLRTCQAGHTSGSYCGPWEALELVVLPLMMGITRRYMLSTTRNRHKKLQLFTKKFVSLQNKTEFRIILVWCAFDVDAL